MVTVCSINVKVTKQYENYLHFKTIFFPKTTYNMKRGEYYLIHTTYTTKLEKKYPETKGTLNNINIIYVISTVQVTN